MERPFFEVFPTLQINEILKNLFAQTMVTKVAITRAKDFLRVYLFSEKLIHKKYIYEIEEAIRTQLFKGVTMTVKILEKFGLSKQYTPKKLMDVYNGITGEQARPFAIGGGTYARHLQEGVAFGMLFQGEPELAHQADESIDLANFAKAARIYAYAIVALCA